MRETSVPATLAVPSFVSGAAEESRTLELFDGLEHGEISPAMCSVNDVTKLRNNNGESMFLVAARIGNTEFLHHFVSSLEHLEDTDCDGWTALLNAAHEGHDEIVQILIDMGAVVDYPDMMGWSPLMWAVYKNHLACVELLLNHHAHVNVIDEEDGLTPLIIASARGYADIIEKLLLFGAQVNACDKFGSTALIWAARKGHKRVVELLLNAGAELDAVGMHSSTALMLATRGNYADVVELLLTREPNVNVTDQNGLSALGIAAREGYAEIAEMLIQSGAYVNVADRYGNSVLSSAVRSGNSNIVRMLLDKHADVNARDSENRTALHLAIDKSYMDMVLVLLEKKPNLELKNKDGDTALLRAVKNRNSALCQLLVNAGSKISATDVAGDNALHLAIRARSKRMTQSLLTNPSDSRLLYRPNKLGQTPYSIDQSNAQPIIPLLFGPIDSETHMDAMLGYDIYSNVLADIACEPNLSLPLTIGLYAKWGSGKSLLLSKMKESMNAFSRSWLDSVHLTWSWSLLFSLALITSLLTLIAVTAVSVTANVHALFFVIAFGGSVFVALLVAYGLIYYGSEVKAWNSYVSMARTIAKNLAHLKLFLSVLILHAPQRTDNDHSTSPVSFLFADYHRLSSIGGEQALAKIVVTLFEAAENHFGTLAVRIYCALKSTKFGGNASKLRRVCGIPVVLLAAVLVLSIMLALVLLMKWLLDLNHLKHGFSSAESYLIGSCVLFAIAFMLMVYPLYVFFGYGLANIPKRRINFAAQRIHKLRFEGFMQKLQQEVDLLSSMIRALDAFTSSQTRLIVVVDGLDNCEQDRMVQTLDALELLFSARPNRPFLVTIAVDPHIIISAINHSMHTALTGTELTGHDYLKTIINMPFYLHNSALRQLQTHLREKRESLAEWRERFKRQDTFHGSYMSLRDGGEMRPQRKAAIMLGPRGLSQSLMTDDYFSNMNPRAMKRIVNALTLTGRLMRAFEIEFSWVTLGYWVSLVEQWPCRMCWLIDRALDLQQDQLPLAQVYNQFKQKIPMKDRLIELDRNPENFESFLEQASQVGPDQLTVGHVRRFVPCTSNLDPYLRKLIRERRMSIEKPSSSTNNVEPAEAVTAMGITGPPHYLFKDPEIWTTIETPLIEMRVDDVVKLIEKLDISDERIRMIAKSMREANLNGLVLSTCELKDVQRTLRLQLGDWTLVKLLINTLRRLEVTGKRTLSRGAVSSNTEKVTLQSIQEHKRLLTARSEVESDHQWLMESLSGMDLAEVNGDDAVVANVSQEASVHFNDGVASDADSTESMCGSRENLLEPCGRPISNANINREQMMRRAQADSVHSEQGSGFLDRLTTLSSNNEEQKTIVTRHIATGDKPPPVFDIFDQSSS